jgi:hypothetical protein
MTLDASGNLLVGTTSAVYGGQLSVKSAGITALSLQNSNFSPASAGTLFNINFGATTGNTYAEMGVTSGGGLVFNNLVLQGGGGNLLVGTTSDLGGLGGKVQISSGASRGIVQSTNSNIRMQEYLVSGTTVGFISNNGTNTTYSTSSDYRLKNTIAPMTGALEKVALLKPCTYKWNVDGSEGEGFIAHELQAVIPNAVTGEKDGVEAYTDTDGVEQTRPSYQGIDTSFLVATLTAAIQELKAIVDAQGAEIAALKGQA